MNAAPTANSVAQWMADQLSQRYWLDQEVAVQDIRTIFGETFTYKNENGNFAIKKDVLREFKKLTGDTVVWERGTRAWRRRKEEDSAGRQQE